MPRHRFIRRSTSSQPPYARPASSPKKSLPCMRATRVKPPTPYSDSGSDSHSDSRSDSRSESSIQVVEKSNDAADSDNGSYIQLVEKGDDAADSDIEILERNEGAGGASPDPDVVELTSVPSSLASEETKRHLKYQRRYRLVLAPAVEDLTHDERAEVVRKYFALAPRLADPKAQQVALFKRVSQNMCRNSTSITNEECSVCMCGPKPNVMLSCGCRHKLFHIKCLQEWHGKEDPSWQCLVNCPTCKAGAKPLNVGWVAPVSK